MYVTDTLQNIVQQKYIPKRYLEYEDFIMNYRRNQKDENPEDIKSRILAKFNGKGVNTDGLDEYIC